MPAAVGSIGDHINHPGPIGAALDTLNSNSWPP